MEFQLLLDQIKNTHLHLQDSAAKAVNKLLTLRNWLIGFYIVEYEQHGEDRAQYGTKLLTHLSRSLKETGLSELSERRLREFRLFYQVYPQIAKVIAIELNNDPIWRSVTAKLKDTKLQLQSKGQSPTDQSKAMPQVPAERLISSLSFTHLVQLLTLEDTLKRTFYELEAIRGNWSVRELKRQINSLYFERMGLSGQPEKLAQLTQQNTETAISAQDYIKNVYAFEFLDLPQKALVTESELEQGLLDHLQSFLLEMGNGFCLEGRQKRILIGDEYFFVDMVFYHRILKCHILVELKIEEFNHVNVGQLNTYINYYKAEVMRPDDNPPIGILLVTNKNEALVQYATAGLDNQLFVSKYLVQLPSREQLERFITNELR